MYNIYKMYFTEIQVIFTKQLLYKRDIVICEINEKFLYEEIVLVRPLILRTLTYQTSPSNS